MAPGSNNRQEWRRFAVGVVCDAADLDDELDMEAEETQFVAPTIRNHCDGTWRRHHRIRVGWTRCLPNQQRNERKIQ